MQHPHCSWDLSSLLFLASPTIVSDLFSGEDQLNQGLKTQGAGEESLQAQEEEIVVNAIDMSLEFIETPKLGLEG